MSQSPDFTQTTITWSDPPPERPNRRAELESYHKTLVTRHVLPIMALMSGLFYLAYFSLEQIKIVTLLCGLCVTAANIYLTSKDRKLKIGPWQLRSRTDLADAIRWGFNLLVADVALAVVFEPSAPAFVAMWLILLASAQADLFEQRHRFAVVALGMGIGAVLMRSMYPSMTLLEFLLTNFCMAAVLIMVGVIESYWMREIEARVESRRREIEARFQTDRIKHDAIIGGHLRTVSHELNNLVGVLDMATSMDDEIKGHELAVIRRAVAYARRINNLVLGDIRDTNTSRVCVVRDLMADINLLLVKEVRWRGFSWHFNLEDDELAGASFQERSGSTYFIVHNLVKNAWEALEASKRGESGFIHVEATPFGNRMLLRIIDNAGGMSEELREAILSGASHSTKTNGHGLGLRFVVDECRRNNYELGIVTTPGEGTSFELKIPLL